MRRAGRRHIGLPFDPFGRLRASRLRTTHHRKRSAFSLIELLVVIAIITVLLAILSPSLRRARELTRRTVCTSQLHQMGISLRAYAANSAGNVMPPGNSTSWPGYGIDSTWSFNYKSMGLAFLITEGYLDDPRVLYCPTWKHPYHQYDQLDTAGDDPVGGPNDYGGWPGPGKPGPNRHRGISYHYRSTFGLEIGDGFSGRGRPPDIRMGRNPAIVADHWSRRYVLLANYAHDDGYPVLHLDGDVRWLPDAGHEFMDDICEYHSHGNWGKQEFIWSGFFDDDGDLR